MTPARALALAVLCAASIAGTWADHRTLTAQKFLRDRAGGTEKIVLAGDFHVHGFPGDGLLPRWELQREAMRRGLDVIAITNHNQTLAAGLLSAISGSDVLVLRGEEITNPRYHMVAAGIRMTIDWRLPAAEAAAAVHAQGGVAIAAHPIETSWRSSDARALGAVDGVEAAHPVVYFIAGARPQLAAFHAAVRSVKPGVAPIGSSDVHGAPGMGDCRTYLIVDERSEKGVLDAIRNGRTVASDGRGTLTGDPALVSTVQQHATQDARIRPPYRLHKALALALLLALACLVVFR